MSPADKAKPSWRERLREKRRRRNERAVQRAMSRSKDDVPFGSAADNRQDWRKPPKF